ncbi:tetratricopeptide repeat protein [Spirosoma oryzae]|uniref:Tetratricopeptide repeat protein n=1 Tax=Spirosoma oryzae TaxID=1469603 RepID=A0A2T0RIZ3_9BACT|nr:NB-ARC domain-containing protein [Spirosoma oryzae]PRY21118.1 tetratricopeptide repeat protein [Spirosoma oryzae]
MSIQEIFRLVATCLSGTNINNIDNSKNVNTGNIFAGGNVHIGDINVNDNPIPKFLTGKPFKLKNIVGRIDDIEGLIEDLSDPNKSLLLVNGEGGIGKTTLLSHYWHGSTDEYNHLGWINAGDSLKSSLLSFAKRISKEYNPALSDETNLINLFEFLSTLDGISLLVIDNVDDEAEIKKYYKLLKSLTNFHVVITTRINKLYDLEIYKVQGLNFENAINLFKLHYKDVLEKDYLYIEKIFVAVGYNTLVIELLSKNLSVINKYRGEYKLEDLVKDLQHKGLLKIKTKNVETTYGSDELTSAKPQDVIKALYDINKLSDNENKLLTNLSLFPSENIGYEELVSIIQPSNFDDFHDDFSSLSDKGWIEYNSDTKSFKINPLIKVIILDKNKLHINAYCDKLINNLPANFQKLNHSQLYLTASISVNLIRAIDNKSKIIAHLCVDLSNYFKSVGDLDGAAKYIIIAKNIFYKLKDNSEYLSCIGSLGIIRHSQGNFKAAMINYEEAIKGYSNSQYNNSLYHQIRFNEHKGMLLYQEGKFKEALKIHLQDYEKIHKKNIDSDVHLLEEFAAINQNIAVIYQDMGEIEKAESSFEEMRVSFEKLIKIDPSSERFKLGYALAYSKIATINKYYGNMSVAIEYYENYYNIIKELYGSNSKNEDLANNLSRAADFLFRIYLDIGEVVKAKTYLKVFESISISIYENNPHAEFSKTGIALVYSRLGALAKKEKKWSQAVAHFKDYNKMCISLLEKNNRSVQFKNGVAISYRALGEVYNQIDSDDEAIDCFKLSIKYLTELCSAIESVEFLENLASSNLALGLTYKKLDRKEEAKVSLLEAYEIWKSLCDKYLIQKFCLNSEQVLMEIAKL